MWDERKLALFLLSGISGRSFNSAFLSPLSVGSLRSRATVMFAEVVEKLLCHSHVYRGCREVAVPQSCLQRL